MVPETRQSRTGTMERMLMAATFLICSALSVGAGNFELPIATTEKGILSFWPRLDATCEMRPLQDNLCCLDSTYRYRSEAHNLLLELLNDLPHPKYEIQGDTRQFLHKSRNGLEVGTRYMCDVPIAQEGSDVPGLGCHKCLEAIAHEIASGMSQNVGRCENSWAVRFGYIYEPDTPWEEDTAWCHLDYWFKVLPSDPSTRFWNTFSRDLLNRATSWITWNCLPCRLSGKLPWIRKVVTGWLLEPQQLVNYNDVY